MYESNTTRMRLRWQDVNFWLKIFKFEQILKYLIFIVVSKVGAHKAISVEHWIFGHPNLWAIVSTYGP